MKRPDGVRRAFAFSAGVVGIVHPVDQRIVLLHPFKNPPFRFRIGRMQPEKDVTRTIRSPTARRQNGKDIGPQITQGIEKRAQHAGLIRQMEAQKQTALARTADVDQHAEHVMVGDDPDKIALFIDHGQTAYPFSSIRTAAASTVSVSRTVIGLCVMMSLIFTSDSR